MYFHFYDDKPNFFVDWIFIASKSTCDDSLHL